MNKIKILCLSAVTSLIGILNFTDIAPDIIKKEYENVMIQAIAKNLFKNEITVSNDKIEVKNYEIINGILYVYPVNKKVILPCNGLITKKAKNKIRISNIYSTFDIYLDKQNYYLYQYYTNNAILGECNEYYAINSSDYSFITRYLLINNEAI